MPITLTRKALLATAVAAAAIAVAYFLLAGDDDQNPIRVKNKQLRIETEDRNWAKTGATEKWKVDNKNPRSATEYVVTAYGADAGCTSVMRGTTVEIRYEIPGATAETRTLTFNLQLSPNGKAIPVLEPTVAMTADNARKTKILRMTDDKEGAITRLVVGGTTCSFPGDRRVEVELCLHNCS